METHEKTVVTIESLINSPLSKVWDCWTKPEHITQWNNASEDWHTPRAENDLRPGGKFSARMEAKDGSMGFDFGGVYDEVREHEYIEYTLGDGRKVDVTFSEEGGSTKIVERFDAENTHPVDFQKTGWKSILDSFKKYTEARG